MNEKGKTPWLVPFFYLGSSLITDVHQRYMARDLNMPYEESDALEVGSRLFDIDISKMIKNIDSVDKLLHESNVISTLRDKIREKFGINTLSAFELGIWLALIPLVNKKSREIVIANAEKHAQIIGLNENYIKDFVGEVQKISDLLVLIDETNIFISETLWRLNSI